MTAARSGLSSTTVTLIDSLGRTTPGYTDSAGYYRITGLRAGSYTARFSRSGYLTEYFDDQPSAETATAIEVVSGETTSSVDAVLAPPPPPGTGSIGGTVTSPGGAPLAGATVDLAVAGESGRPTFLATAYTEADGGYEFTELGDRRYFVRFSSAGMTTEWWSDAVFASLAESVVTTGDAVTGIDGELAESATLVGTVTAVDGSPLAGIRVTITADYRQTWAVSTDASGNFRLADLQPGQFSLTYADPQGRYFTDDRRVSVDAAATVRADVILDPAAVITGMVTGPDGQTVAHASVRLFRSATGFITVSTDAAGRYRIGQLQPGSYRVRVLSGQFAAVWYGGGAYYSEAESVEVTAGVTDGVDIALLERAVIHGTVVNEVGAPVGSVPVYASDVHDGLADIASTTTNVLGQFVLRPAVVTDVVVGTGAAGVWLGEYAYDTVDPDLAYRLRARAGPARRRCRDDARFQPAADRERDERDQRRVRPPRRHVQPQHGRRRWGRRELSPFVW